MSARETLEKLRVGDIETKILDAIREVLAENEREGVMPKLPDDWHPRDERDARIEELEAKIEAALAIAENEPGYPSVDWGEVLERVVKALRGKDVGHPQADD